jgi:hypothetical protein
VVTAKQILTLQKAKGQKRELLMTAFIKENEALVDYVVLRFAAQWRLEHQLEDLKQQARLAMVKAVGSFKIKKNGIDKKTGKRFSAKTWNCAQYFSNWFWLISRDELQKAAKALGVGTGKYAQPGPRPYFVPLEGSYSGTATLDSGMSSGDSIMLGACDNQELVTAIHELPAQEQYIVYRLAEGDSALAIGRSLGIKDIVTVIAGIREKLT